jgi:hypothetical protein
MRCRHDKLEPRDGFVARIDADTGAVGWTKRLDAKDGEAGALRHRGRLRAAASVLDRLGLPPGRSTIRRAQEIAAFHIRPSGGSLLPAGQTAARPTRRHPGG